MELLAVLAIIAILFAIIVPVISRVRASAHASGCVANLRSLGTAHALWRTDRSLKYESGLNFVNKRPSQLFFEGGYITDPEIYQCPAVSLPNDAETYPAIDSSSWPSAREYHARFDDKELSVMVNALTFYRSWLGYGRDYAQNFFAFDDHSKVPLFMDGNNFQINTSAWRESRELRIQARHDGRANVVFMDGRVDALDAEGIAELHPLGDPAIRLW